MTATALALSMLRGRDHCHITVKQVNYLASLNVREVGEEHGRFRYPDYTVVRYDGRGDGWELFRMPNGAGILKLVRHSAVIASGENRRREWELEELAGRLNEIAARHMDAGTSYAADPEYVRCQAEYRALCRSR